MNMSRKKPCPGSRSQAWSKRRFGHMKSLQVKGRPGSAGRDRRVHAGKVKGNEDQLSQPKGQGALSFPDAVAFLPPLCVLTYLDTSKNW